MSTGRWVVVIVILSIIALAIAYGFIARAVPVDLSQAKRGEMAVFVEEEGRTRVKEKFVISAPASGYLRRIRLDVGSAVKKGEIIAHLDPLKSAALDPRSRAAAEAAVLAAEAALRAAEEKAGAAAANAGYATSNYERLKKLFAEGFVSRDALEQAESEAKRSEAARLADKAAADTARFELGRARTNLKYAASSDSAGHEDVITVKSPINGAVLKVNHESEGAVNQGEPLIEIGDSRNLEIVSEVLSADAVKIKPGMPVLFDRWGGDALLSGKVRIVEPAGFTKVSSLGVEEQRVLVISDITSPPEVWQKLGDSYRVEAGFIIWEGKDILLIPAGALFRSGEGWGVFTVENNRVHLRKVEVGHRNGLVAEINSGLTEGEFVIAQPDDSVKEGIRVKIRMR